MMAGLFLVFALAIAAVLARQRLAALALVFIGLVLSLVMFWQHAKDIVQINI